MPTYFMMPMNLPLSRRRTLWPGLLDPTVAVLGMVPAEAGFCRTGVYA
jgi:hypothetical protein